MSVTYRKHPVVKVCAEDVVIRPAVPNDAEQLFDLIVELAEYERAKHEVAISADAVRDCCFGDNAFCGAFVAEWRPTDGRLPLVIGLAIYFYRFSTWKGRQLYLEEFVVSDRYRGGGVGRRLFDRVVQHAKKTKCSGMFWQVLEWNEPAINFYRKYKAEFDPQWHNCSILFSSKL